MIKSSWSNSIFNRSSPSLKIFILLFFFNNLAFLIQATPQAITSNNNNNNNNLNNNLNNINNINQTNSTSPSPLNNHNDTNHTNLTINNTSNFNSNSSVNSNINSTNATNTNSSQANNVSSTLNQYEVIPLDTKITAPLGILGALLIISGTPMAFWGGRNRWSSYFLTGAYVAAMIVMIPILRFGVIEQDHPPSNVIQGLFVFAGIISALAAGAVAVIFWKGTKYLIGALGGFIISLYILSLRSNTLIRAPGLRWVFIIATIATGFTLATIPQLAIHVTLFATAIVGAAAVVLGIDCFTTGGLKEYWLYILGFSSMFPKLHGYFPLTVTMQAELGVMAGLLLMGAAVQWRLLEIIKKKIKELQQLDNERRLEEDAAAYKQSMALDADLAHWEKRHGDDSDSITMPVHGSPTKSLTFHNSNLSLYPRPPSTSLLAYQPVSRRSSELLPALDGGGGGGQLGLTDDSEVSPMFKTNSLSPPQSREPSHDLIRHQALPRPAPLHTASIDFGKFENDRRYSRPPGAPASWTNHTRSSSIPSALTLTPGFKDSNLPIHSPLIFNGYPGTDPLNSSDHQLKKSQQSRISQRFERRSLSNQLSAHAYKRENQILNDFNQQKESFNRSSSAYEDLEKRQSQRRHSEAPSRVLIGTFEQTSTNLLPQDQRRQSQVMTIEQLEQRHKQAMKKLQQPINELARDHLEKQGLRDRYEKELDEIRFKANKSNHQRSLSRDQLRDSSHSIKQVNQSHGKRKSNYHEENFIEQFGNRFNSHSNTNQSHPQTPDLSKFKLSHSQNNSNIKAKPKAEWLEY
ncbi:hypothetical protein O181_073017 [Austropuccinia psidii MF-1]|uniref:TM7S3/TM198-like domain-containing protein n=1 Tax=Austropuccinia psidii MF-1 TaxID=1389203 RepID=A0A9Q3F890_9BASI|nr:hypothetical protein [Austropuccinia psidii MF-1]